MVLGPNQENHACQARTLLTELRPQPLTASVLGLDCYSPKTTSLYTLSVLMGKIGSATLNDGQQPKDQISTKISYHVEKLSSS